MPVRAGEKCVADAKYRIHVKEDIHLKHDYRGIFNKGLVRHGVYFKVFPLLDWYCERRIQLLKRENRGKITATIVDVINRDDRF
jgi:hypothetical protein